VDLLARIARTQRGQASVELVAALPVVLLLAAVVWQCALAGHTALLAAHAARAAARAELVDADPESAARSVLPSALEDGLRLERREGAVRARLRVPLLLYRWRLPIHVHAEASLEEAG
jgi:pilus assembly protein CpaE